MNTLETALAKRAQHQAWKAEVAAIDHHESLPAPTRKPGRKPTHGHYAAYKRHLDNNEEPCAPCIEAWERTKKANRDRSKKKAAINAGA